jgi:3-hydroxyisobutyrate dehydrogenase-like beta-hydroxyacid dehydrogenase
MTRQIGFIGLGTMGFPMAANLLDKGFPLTAFDIRQEPLDRISQKGAYIAHSAKETAARSDVIITMLLSSSHVESAVLGAKGVMEGIRPGSIVIDMSTIAPATTRKVGSELEKKAVEMLDAPVARGATAAIKGKLSIVVGGKKKVFEDVREILNAMGTDITYVGELGCGSMCKLVNQLILAVSVTTIAEGLVLGVKGGVEPDVLLDVLEKGSADSFALQNHFKKFVMRGDFSEKMMPVDYILKDLRLILDTGQRLGVPLYQSALATQMYEFTRASGKNRNYFPIVTTVLEEITGVKVRTKSKT